MSFGRPEMERRGCRGVEPKARGLSILTDFGAHVYRLVLYLIMVQHFLATG